jgi:hypothetical protein
MTINSGFNFFYFLKTYKMLNFSSKVFFIAFFVLTIFACAKKAQPKQSENRPNGGRGGGQPEFSTLLGKMDANKDAKISASEAKGPLKDRFSQIDTDKDGFISEDEFKKSPPPPPRKKN